MKYRNIALLALVLPLVTLAADLLQVSLSLIRPNQAIGGIPTAWLPFTYMQAARNQLDELGRLNRRGNFVYAMGLERS